MNTTNAQLISSIETCEDLAMIAQMNNVSLNSLKLYLVNSLKDVTPIQSDTKENESKREAPFDDTSYGRIIRESLIDFSDEQLEFMRLAVKERQSLSLLSGAGYGKSAVIETMMDLFKSELKPHTQQWFRTQYGKATNHDDLVRCPTVGLCASTGKAASLLINARTFHSYFGIGIAQGTPERWFKNVSTMKYLANTFDYLRAVQVIVIDEISMISAELLDGLSEYLQRIRKSSEPFGGIQLILVGDACQLPPVRGTFFFRSLELQAAKVTTFRLTKCFRQSDPEFLKVLEDLRFANVSAETTKILTNCKEIDPEFTNGMKPLRLMAINTDVDAINERELNKECERTNQPIVSFATIISRGADRKKIASICKSSNIPDEVKIAIGCQVVVTYNISTKIVNGTQGKIVAIRAHEVDVELVDRTIAVIGRVVMKDPDHPDIQTAKPMFSYLPIRLSYASTIHKCQGMTLDLLEVDLTKAFAHGQAYVAISRVRSLNGLIVRGFSRSVVKCDPMVKALYGM